MMMILPFLPRFFLRLRLAALAVVLLGMAFAACPAHAEDAGAAAAVSHHDDSSADSPKAKKNRLARKHALSQTESHVPHFRPLKLSYEVYVGGAHLIGADIKFRETDGAYVSHVEGRTLGIWHRFFPWNTTLESSGRIKGDDLVPVAYESRDVWGRKLKVTRLKFEKDGEAKAEFEPPAGAVPPSEIVTGEQRRGALDPVTALLRMLTHVAVEQDCNVEVPVFDGKRRFDVTGADLRAGSKVEEEIDAGDYGVFKGKARVCSAGFRMVSGQWTDRQKSGFWKKSDAEDGREPFRVWLARLSPELPELPVMLESASIWGRIVIHLTGWNYEP